MFPINCPHYVFVPSSPETGIFHELEPVSDFCHNAFVVVPYQNPGKRETTPQYYKVKSKKEIRLPARSNTGTSVAIDPETSFEAYKKNFEKLQQHIRRGDIYEINYCCQFTGNANNVDALRLCMQLYSISKAPYTMLAKLGDEYIVCASPELFLRKNGNELVTKPIKGTSKRGHSEHEDNELKNALYNSMKERTENVMAVDVARNDLSMLAARGSVTVNKLYNIETFENVHQMVSTVKCILKRDFLFDEILQATFPMASMTGAPKISAMNIIDLVETFDRHFYSGAMGFVDESGDFELAVIIRSIFYNSTTNKISFATGGAITYLSNVRDEYDECLLKAEGMLKALGVKMN